MSYSDRKDFEYAGLSSLISKYFGPDQKKAERENGGKGSMDRIGRKEKTLKS